MSQDHDDTPKSAGAQKPAGEKATDAAKRPYATLDLKATEVKSEPKAAASASSASSSSSTEKADGSKAGAAAASSADKSRAAPAAGASGSKPASGDGDKASGSAGRSAAPSPARASSSGAWLPSLVAGAAGAVLAMLGLGSMGLIGGDGDAAKLAERLAALEKTAASQPGDVAAKITAADARLAAIEKSARDLAASQAALTAEAKAIDARVANQSPAAAAAADKVQKLEQQLADLAAAAASDPQRGRIPALAQITTRLGELDTQLTTRASSLKSELSQEMEKRFAASDATQEQARARLAQRTQSLEQTMKSVADDTTALRTAVDGLKSDLDQRLKATAKPADVTAAIEPVSTKIASLEKSVAGVVRSEQDRNATAGNVLLSIELNNLKRAIDRGGRYASELAAVKKVGGDKLNLTVLESAQAAGVPSLPALQTEFRSLAYTIIDADAEPEGGSVVDRLLASAQSVVRVRKVSHNADDKSTEAVVGRMEAELKEGRLGDLLEESKGLNDKARAAALPWLKKIEARYEIEKAIASLEQSLKNALAGSASAKGAN